MRLLGILSKPTLTELTAGIVALIDRLPPQSEKIEMESSFEGQPKRQANLRAGISDSIDEGFPENTLEARSRS